MCAAVTAESDEEALARRWSQAWQQLGLRGDAASLAPAVLGAWREPQRHYHTLEHLQECLTLFDRYRHLAGEPAEVEWAIWFHDAVYDPHRHDNEAESAAWSHMLLQQCGVDTARIERIDRLILATAPAAQPATPDEALLADIDLAILASAPQRFDRYERDIRREYAHVPLPDFAVARRRLLQQLAEREPLFRRPELRPHFESAARNNLRRALRPWRFLAWRDDPRAPPASPLRPALAAADWTASNRRSARMAATQMAATQVVCPHCDTVNRVPIERLDQHPSCGRCKGALFTGHPQTLTARNFDRQIGRSELPVLVDFWAPWCGPCRSMAPSFERAAAELEPQMRLAKLDTEAEPAIASRFNIRSIPTLIVFRNGQELRRMSGALPLPELLRWARSG